MKKLHFHIVILATIIFTHGCSACSTATRRTGHIVRMVTIDAPLSVAGTLYDAMGRMDHVGIGLSKQAQFEEDVAAGGDTTAKTIARQYE